MTAASTRRDGIAHAKTMVVDDALKLTGSNNWTRGSAENSEQLNLVPPGCRRGVCEQGLARCVALAGIFLGRR